MKIMVLEGGAVVLQMDGGMSFKFTLHEADPVDLPPVRPDPTGRPVICARFQCFDDARLVSKQYFALRPHEFTSRATHSLHLHLGCYGLSRQAMDSTLTHFFSSGESAEKLTSYSNSNNSIGYFCLDITREGWLGSPYHRAQEQARAAQAAAMEEDTDSESDSNPPNPNYAVYEDDMPMGPTRPDVIRLLFKLTWSLTAQGFSGIDCAICLERLIEGDGVTIMPCRQHCFHTHCLLAWLNINNRCPVCRFYLPSTASPSYSST